LLGLLRQLGADALEGIAYGCVGSRRLLIAMIDFKAAAVCVRLDQLVHSMSALTIMNRSTPVLEFWMTKINENLENNAKKALNEFY
jgi:hypothetical protein